jgi:hypothetical protein
MEYIILKQLLPAMEGTENYNEDFHYIDKCGCIDNDEIFSYPTQKEAEDKIEELKTDSRYTGRKLKIAIR